MGWCVGLTGGIGSGKTRVSCLLAELGAGVVDTDEISHQLTAPNGAAMAAIRLAFGDEFVTADGALERTAMRALIFNDNTARARLEAILHPVIQARALTAIAQSSAPYTVLVVPLLLETGGYQGMVKRILVVDCDEQLQIARTMQRSALSEEQVRAIMAKQMSRKLRLARADDIIVNNGGMDDLRRQVQTLHQAYLVLAKS